MIQMSYKGGGSMEEQSKAIVEGKPLEYPEIVQDTVEVEFPEITDFVRNMKLNIWISNSRFLLEYGAIE